MQAFAVFSGGGIRGAAFVGALRAAEELNIEFVGYAGVSAGSVIALLAAAGYSGDMLDKILTKDLRLATLLERDGKDLGAVGRAFARFQRAQHGVGKFAAAWRFFLGHRTLLDRVLLKYGLDKGERIADLLQALIVQRNPSLEGVSPISFRALHAAGAGKHSPILLKILATDIKAGKQVIFPNPNPMAPEDHPLNYSVIDAVRASISYPLLFQPKEMGDMRLVDGGISSGLPVFLFEQELKDTRIPIIAFELGDAGRRKDAGQYNFYHFLSDLLGAALDSSEETKRITTDGIYPVWLSIPENITMNWNINEGSVADVVDAGLSYARTQLAHIKQQESWAAERRAKLAGNIPMLLESLIGHVEKQTPLKDCRAYVMLRDSDNMRQVTYQCGMSNSDPDREMRVGLTEGLTGQAWLKNQPVLTPLDEFRATASPDAVLPPPRQKVIITVPLRDYGGAPSHIAASQLPLLGTLSVDSASPMQNIAIPAFKQSAEHILESWGEVVSMQLRHRGSP